MLVFAKKINCFLRKKVIVLAKFSIVFYCFLRKKILVLAKNTVVVCFVLKKESSFFSKKK